MYSGTSSLTTGRQQPQKRHHNRKRNGYELTSQRSMFPVAIGASLATFAVYSVLLYYAQHILPFEIKGLTDPQKDAPVEYERIYVRDTPEEKLVEADEAPPPDEPAEITDIAHEPVEIDILDANVEELIMAPGPTDLAVPEPTPTAEQPSAVAEMLPGELSSDLLSLPEVPVEAMKTPEPTPVNHNEVIARATAQLDDVDGAEGLTTADLQNTARESNAGDLPADNRSLEELIGESNLGSSSGVARLGTDLLFGFNECKLKSSARITMLQLAALIQKNQNTIFIIEGHTDSIGDDNYNALLSMQRAAAVREWLRKNQVPTNNVYIRACANRSPLVPTTKNREQEASNRRVEIHMRRADEKMPDGCENHDYPVDLTTKVRDQISSGVSVPRTYVTASASVNNQAATRGNSSQPRRTENQRNNRQNNQRNRRNNNNRRTRNR